MPRGRIRVAVPREQRGQVDRRHVAGVQQQALRAGQIEQPAQVDVRGVAAEVVADPPGPVQEVRVVPREAQQADGVLHDRLLREVDERGELPRVRPEVLLGQHERPVRRERPVQLDDPGAGGPGDLLGAADDGVPLPQALGGGALEQRVVVRGEDVRPGEFEQGAVQTAGGELPVGRRLEDQVIEGGAAERYRELLGQPQRRTRGRRLAPECLPVTVGGSARRVEPVDEEAGQVGPHGHRRPAGSPRLRVSAHAGTDHDRGPVGPERPPDRLDVLGIREVRRGNVHDDTFLR